MLTTEKVAVYQFSIKADNRRYATSFQLTDGDLAVQCNCKNSKKSRHCWHINYVLAGRTRRLSNSEWQLQSDLIKKIAATDTGIELVKAAKAAFLHRESCRRCASQNVIILRRSLLGRLIAVFKPQGHRHFCKSCKWSW